jgi:hypothetical protein
VKSPNRARDSIHFLLHIERRQEERVAAELVEVERYDPEYSLGPVLYKLLCDEPPARSKPAAPNRTGAVIDRDLDAIVMKAIRAEPHARYSTADKVAEDLRAWLDRRPVSARQGEHWYHARRQLRRHWVLLAAGTIAASGLLLGLVLARTQRDVAQQRFEVARRLANEFLSLDKEVQNLPGRPRSGSASSAPPSSTWKLCRSEPATIGGSRRILPPDIARLPRHRACSGASTWAILRKPVKTSIKRRRCSRKSELRRRRSPGAP